MLAVVGDLVAAADPDPPGLSGPQFRDFDVAAVGGGFHHFADPALAAARLVARLRPGGVLLIWDFMPPHDDGDDEHGNDEGNDGGRGDHRGEGGSGNGGTRGEGHHTITQHHGFTERGIRQIYEKAGAGRNFTLVDLGAGFMFGHGPGHATPKDDGEKTRRRVFLSWGEKVGSS